MSFPPHTYFVISAVFHYLGPAFAVLLFRRVDVVGVAWLRIASAALVFAVWRRPWRHLATLPVSQHQTLLALGAALAAMNTCFYLAIDRLPLGTVGAIEFLGPVALAAAGARSPRSLAALGLAVGGVALLSDYRIATEPAGLAFAFANCACFVLYIVLGHRLAQGDDGHRVDRLGAAMLVALAVVTPLGLSSATAALLDPRLLAAGFGVGVCSSVVPYLCDQLAMARMPRATFALLARPLARHGDRHRSAGAAPAPRGPRDRGRSTRHRGRGLPPARTGAMKCCTRFSDAPACACPGWPSAPWTSAER